MWELEAGYMVRRREALKLLLHGSGFLLLCGPVSRLGLRNIALADALVLHY